MKKLVFLFALSLCSLTFSAQEYCGTEPSSTNTFFPTFYGSTSISPKLIGLKFVLLDTLGSSIPYLNESSCYDALEYLNTEFSPYDISFDMITCPVIVYDTSLFHFTKEKWPQDYQSAIPDEFSDAITIFLTHKGTAFSGVASFETPNLIIFQRSAPEPGFDFNWMNSVILHEMGHVLKLRHTHHNSPFMNQELEPIESNWSYGPGLNDSINICPVYINLCGNIPYCNLFYGDRIPDTPPDPSLIRLANVNSANVSVDSSCV